MSNGILFEIQPDDLEPVEYTHFDMWFGDDDLDAYDNASNEDKLVVLRDILATWSETLDITFIVDETLPIDTIIESVILQILREGYGVFEGTSFIEIFARQEETDHE